MADPNATLCARLLIPMALLSLAAGPALARQRSPVVAELFTSQGCSACLAANDLPAALDGRKDVLALTFPVDYWDYLGWRDTYAQPTFSDRQKAYAKALGEREVFTPQMVVDGSSHTGKAQPGQSLMESTDALIRKAAKARGRGPSIAFTRHGKVWVGSGSAPRGGVEVWLVRYKPAPAEVVVTAGDNRGQTVRYHNVVCALERLGTWTGRARTYAEPAAAEGALKNAVLVQVKAGGHVLAALAAPDSR